MKIKKGFIRDFRGALISNIKYAELTETDAVLISLIHKNKLPICVLTLFGSSF